MRASDGEFDGDYNGAAVEVYMHLLSNTLFLSMLIAKLHSEQPLQSW